MPENKPETSTYEKIYNRNQKMLEEVAPDYFKDKSIIPSKGKEKSDFWERTKEGFTDENVVASGIRWLVNNRHKIQDPEEERPDPDYDVYEDIDMGSLPKEYPDWFRVVHTKKEADWLRGKIEKHIRKENSMGNLLGAVLGIGFDPLTWAPIGIASKVSRIKNLSMAKKATVAGTGSAAVETFAETIRSMPDPLRPIEFSYYGIAGSATIGAALAPLFTKYGVPRSLIAKLAQRISGKYDNYEKAFAPNTGAYKYNPSKHTMQTSPAALGTGTIEPRSLSAAVTPKQITKIISGGQVGVDEIGLKVGRNLGIDIGGTAAKGYIQTPGPSVFKREQIRKILKEGPEGKDIADVYRKRTLINVKDSDGTVYFDAKLGGSRGWLATSSAATKLNKPIILNPSASQLGEWLEKNNIKTLNVAGNRWEKGNEKILKTAEEVLTEALGKARQDVGAAAVSVLDKELTELEKQKAKLTPFAKELADKDVLAVSDGWVIDPRTPNVAMKDKALLSKGEIEALNKGDAIDAQTYYQKKLETDMIEAFGLETIKDNAIKRTLQSPELVTNNLGEGIVTNVMYLKKNKLGKPSSVSVEMAVQRWIATGSEVNRKIRNHYADYIALIKGRPNQPTRMEQFTTHLSATLDTRITDPRRHEYMTFAEFEHKAVLSRFDKSLVTGEKAAVKNKIIEAGQEFTSFFKEIKKQAIAVKSFEKWLKRKIGVGEGTLRRYTKRGGLDMDEESIFYGKSYTGHELSKEVNKLKEYKEYREKNFERFKNNQIKFFKDEDYFPLMIDQNKLETNVKGYAKLWIEDGIKKGLTKRQSQKQTWSFIKSFLKDDYFKPMNLDATGFASSTHARKLTYIDWSNPQNSELLITDSNSILRHYARSMTADIELSKLSTMLGGSGDHSLQDLLALVHANWRARVEKLSGISFTGKATTKVGYQVTKNPWKINQYKWEFDFDKTIKGIDKQKAIIDLDIKFAKKMNIHDVDIIYKGTKNKGLINKALKQREEDLRDIRALRDLVRGHYGLPENPRGMTASTIRLAKIWNAMSMLTGFLAASVDVGRLGTYFKMRETFGGTFASLFKDLGNLKKGIKLSNKQMMTFGEGWDLFNGSRMRMFTETGDTSLGLSRFQTWADRAQTGYFQFINGMASWNAAVKSIASMMWNTEVINVLLKWDKTNEISKLWKLRLANAGISVNKNNPVTSKILKGLNQKNGYLKGDYIRVADTARWSDDAKYAWEAALAHDIPKIIVTPSKGDVALWMNTQWGGLLAQFKKFSQAATNRVLTAGIQEGHQPFLKGAVLLIGMGAFVDFVRTEYNFDRSYAAKSWSQKFYDALERSALLGYFMDINKSIEALTDNKVGVRPIFQIGYQYPTSLSSKAGAILGPGGTTAVRLFDTLAGIPNGMDYHTRRNVRRLWPTGQVFWLDTPYDYMFGT